MSKRHLYLLALAIIAAAFSAMYYKWKVLEFPLQPDTQVRVWTVQAHIEFQPRRAANAVTLQLPDETPGFTVLNERFVARNYSKNEIPHPQGREVQWANRRAVGEQDLYYRATVVRSDERAPKMPDFEPVIPAPPELEEPYATAADALLQQVREGSVNNITYTRELLRRLGEPSPSEEVTLLAERYGNDESARAAFAVQLLARRSIPARVIHGLRLTDEPREGEGRLQ